MAWPSHQRGPQRKTHKPLAMRWRCLPSRTSVRVPGVHTDQGLAAADDSKETPPPLEGAAAAVSTLWRVAGRRGIFRVHTGSGAGLSRRGAPHRLRPQRPHANPHARLVGDSREEASTLAHRSGSASQRRPDPTRTFAAQP